MNIELQQNPDLSSRRRRIAAFIIDHVVITFLMVSLIFLLIDPNLNEENDLSAMNTIMLSVMIPGFLIYFAKDSIQGISLGKWIMGIMVRDQNNPDQTPSFGRLFVRNLFIILWPIEFIVLASSQKKKRIGDNVAKTIVLNNPNKSAKGVRIAVLVGVLVLSFAFMFLYVGNAMKSSDAYKVAIQEIEQNEDILKETGGIKEYGMMPSGNISTVNGSGNAQLQIKVIGNEKDVMVSVHLTKEPNESWKVVELNK